MTASIPMGQNFRERPLLGVAFILLLATGLMPLYQVAAIATEKLTRYLVLPDSGGASAGPHMLVGVVWAVSLVTLLLSLVVGNRKAVNISAVAFAATLTILGLAVVEFMSAGMNASAGPTFFLLPVAAACMLIGYRRYR